MSVAAHDEAVRSIHFSADGGHLFTGSTDKSVQQLDVRGAPVWRRPGAHNAAVNVVAPFAGFMLASGDEDGGVKIWDTRAAGAGLALPGHSDVINDLCVDEGRATLLAASGDGTIGVFDLRKGKRVHVTEQMDDEFLSLGILKNGAAVVAGSQDGVLLTWQWGHWGDNERDAEYAGPDVFTGHPQSIDALLVVDADTIITGSSDGILRLLTVQPNKLVGVLGEHDDFPVERLAWSRDHRLVGSASHDNTVKFWDVAYLFEDDADGDGDGEGAASDEEMAEAAAPAAAAAASKRRSGGGAGGRRASRGPGPVSSSKFTALPALALPGQDDDDSDDSDGSNDDDDDDLEGAEWHSEEDDAAARGVDRRAAFPGPRAGAAAGGAGAAAAAAAAVAHHDSDEEMEGGGVAARAPAPASRRGKAAAAGPAKGKGKLGKGGRGGAKSKAEQFFEDL
jgi:hypothetical protein